jgi:hypothetical protein
VLEDRDFQIVYVDMWPLQGGLSGQYYVVVVVGVAPNSVTVLDPQCGERRLPREDFQVVRAAMHFLTMVIAIDVQVCFWGSSTTTRI